MVALKVMSSGPIVDLDMGVLLEVGGGGQVNRPGIAPMAVSLMDQSMAWTAERVAGTPSWKTQPVEEHDGQDAEARPSSAPVGAPLQSAARRRVRQRRRCAAAQPRLCSRQPRRRYEMGMVAAFEVR